MSFIDFYLWLLILLERNYIIDIDFLFMIVDFIKKIMLLISYLWSLILLERNYIIKRIMTLIF